MKNIDPALNKYYSEGNEKNRLSTHQLERDRTFHLLKKYLPSPPATILDVGGAAGVYAFPLSNQGYQVHLIDPIALHIEQAKAQPCTLASITQGDARNLHFASNSADVILLLGPLYHLPHLSDRLTALHEAYRVLKPQGILFAVGISRFASFMDYTNKSRIYEKFSQVENDLTTGLHKKSTQEDFTFGYFHHPHELIQEIETARFNTVTLHAIEGPIWASSLIDPLTQDPTNWAKFIALLDAIETDPTLIGASAHIMALAKKP